MFETCRKYSRAGHLRQNCGNCGGMTAKFDTGRNSVPARRALCRRMQKIVSKNTGSAIQIAARNAVDKGDSRRFLPGFRRRPGQWRPPDARVSRGLGQAHASMRHAHAAAPPGPPGYRQQRRSQQGARRWQARYPAAAGAAAGLCRSAATGPQAGACRPRGGWHTTALQRGYGDQSTCARR